MCESVESCLCVCLWRAMAPSAHTDTLRLQSVMVQSCHLYHHIHAYIHTCGNRHRPSHDANNTPLPTGTASTNPCKYMYKICFSFATVVLPALLRPGTTAACPHATRGTKVSWCCFAPTGQSFVFFIPALLACRRRCRCRKT